MSSTRKTPLGADVDRRRASATAVAGAMLAAIGLAYILLVAQPGLLRSFNAALSQWPSSQGKPTWLLTLLVIGVAAIGVSLSMLVLAIFVRSAEARPYRWLSPLLVVFASVIVVRSAGEASIADVPLPLFTACCGLLMMGGGALLQTRARLLRVAGGLLLGLPVSALLATFAFDGGGVSGPALAASWAAQDGAVKVAVLALAVTGAAIALLALGTARAPAVAGAGYGYELDDDEDDDDSVSPDGARVWEVLSTAVITLALGALVAYLGVYRPLLAREARAVVSVNQRLEELEQLRASLARERANLEAELATERTKAREAQAQLGRMSAAPAALVQPEPPAPVTAGAAGSGGPHPAVKPRAMSKSDVTPAPKAPAKPKPAAIAHRSAAAPSTSAPAKAVAPAPTRAARPDKDKSARPTAADKRRLSEAVDDDPIGGLDDL